MLETLNQTNIGHLNIDEPRQSGLTFDPRRDLTENDWQGFFGRLAATAHLTNPNVAIWDFLNLASRMKLVSPERMNDMSFLTQRNDFVKNELLRLKGMLSRDFIDGTDLHKFVITKILFPELYKEVVDEHDVIGLDHSIRWNVRRNPDNFDSFSYVTELKILFPNWKWTSPDFTWEEFLNRYSSIKRGEVDAETADSFTDVLACLKITDRETFGKINLTDKTWRNLRRYLSEKRLGDSAIGVTTNMAIMAAEEIVITDDQFYLVMPDPNFSPAQTPALPETRKF